MHVTDLIPALQLFLLVVLKINSMVMSACHRKLPAPRHFHHAHLHAPYIVGNLTWSWSTIFKGRGIEGRLNVGLTALV